MESLTFESILSAYHSLTPSARELLTQILDWTSRRHQREFRTLELVRHRRSEPDMEESNRTEEADRQWVNRNLEPLTAEILDHGRPTGVSLLAAIGSGKYRCYGVPAWTRMAYRHEQYRCDPQFPGDEREGRLTLLRAIAHRFLRSLDDGEELDPLVLRPPWFFDTSVMAQPAFCADPDLRLTHASTAFHELFRTNPDRLPLDLVDFFKSKELYVYDTVRGETTDRHFLDALTSELRDGQTVNHLMFEWKPPGGDESTLTHLLDVFITIQERFPGIQGTFVRVNGPLQHETRTDSKLIEHEISEPLARINSAVGSAEDLLNSRQSVESIPAALREEVIERVRKIGSEAHESITRYTQHLSLEIDDESQKGAS